MGVALAASTQQGTARAESGTEGTPPRHVELKVVTPKEDRGLENVLSELLGRLQVTTRFTTMPSMDTEEMWSPQPGAPPAVARVWIDLRDPSQVTVYLTGDRQDRVLIRQVPLVLALDEVAREEIAHIVEAAVDELLLGGQIGVERKRPPEAPPKIELPPPPPPLASLDVGLGYETQVWNMKPFSLLHGPAAFVGFVKKSGRFRPGLWLSGELRFAHDIKDPNIPVEARLEQGALRLLAIVDHSLSNRWTVRAGLGGGVDLVNIDIDRTQTAGPGVITRNDRLTGVPMLRGLALAKFAFTTKSELFFGVAADLDLLDARYDVGYEPGFASVSDPPRVRPTALIGVASDVLAY